MNMKSSFFVRKKPVRHLMSVLAVVALTACASGPKDYAIQGEATPVINRDTSGKPLSVVVRVYQLKDAGEFNKLTYDAAASGKPDTELFGNELISRSELVLLPGSKQTIKDQIKPETRFVGIVGYFRKPEPHYWRALVDAGDVRSDGLAFKVQDCYLQVQTPKPIALPGVPATAKPDCGLPGKTTGRR
ncbi:type VI secretion system lipoprotein TssJ [Jeongeupia sp. USM3]|uniref:type VI secretion system lipoprotein TssJ n=1 Tax=Jeongeupia sp. USM3 TaxID=1906741 RepID=UPI00089DED4C|nr:type VI secretion system lipoprotein TssJ [Jeongeupia sp. USM3]AOX99940.1 type VI secretion system-associated lipoprotein [Jeongeupia sp. USM3]